MGFRFRKTIRLFPGVRLNISKSGVSTSIGRPGATINLGRKGVRGTVGLPGTGLSYSEMLARPDDLRTPDIEEEDRLGRPAGRRSGFTGIVIVLVIIALGIALILFFAGLMSSRQSSPGGTFEPGRVSSSEPSVAAPSSAPSAQDEPAPAEVRASGDLDCRADPNHRARVVASLSSRDGLEVVSRQAGWTRVTSGDQDCWVESELLDR